jgi:hypothetical protein
VSRDRESRDRGDIDSLKRKEKREKRKEKKKEETIGKTTRERRLNFNPKPNPENCER